MITVNWNELFDVVEFPYRCIAGDCEYLLRTKDGFGTGDSPTGYDCSCRNAKHCPFYNEAIMNIACCDD